MQSFHEFLIDRLEVGGFSTADALASFLPLARQVAAAHADGMVAPLEGVDALGVEQSRISFDESERREWRLNRSAIERIARQPDAAFEIVRQSRIQSGLDFDELEPVEPEIGDREQAIVRPVYLPGYVAWEHLLDHHDPLTDIHVLGLILASLACGLDLNEPTAMKKFVAHRDNLFKINRDLHPVLARAVVQMTELDRRRRPQDLAALVHALENYGDQEVDLELDLARVDGFGQKDLRSRHQIVLAKLQERLFEVSRRNRLLQFRATGQSINLTQASVPLSFDPEHIGADQILTWDGEFRDRVTRGKAITLNKLVNVEEVLYAPSVLDRIRVEASRDQKEYGFQHLRLMICFLRWANLKESPPEQYDSPLVLLPVELKKKKGVRDTFSIEPLETVAEVNPVLRHQFKQLYNIDLPETIDLEVADVETLYARLKARIESNEPAVTLEKIERPQIELIHRSARLRLDQYCRRAGIRPPQQVEPKDVASENVAPQQVEADIVPQSEPGTPAVVERERTVIQIREVAGDNPYRWQFDLCSVTLGNIKYRKMSLVRDYEELLDDEMLSPAFNSTFSLVPRPVETAPPELPPLAGRFHVVPCDPTQAASVARAATGQSYIIQGPPGTGKSQTITNLIADYIARGLRVLFVCEKRAAIDVVFARLRAQGLADLCCLIHDSQADKKSFVMDLKNTYESFLGDVATTGDGDQGRDSLVAAVERELRSLGEFDAAMRAEPKEIGVPVHRLLRRLVELRDRRPELSPLEIEQLPDYAKWHACRDRIRSFTEKLTDIQPDGVFGHHPLRRLRGRLASADRPLAEITEAMATARSALDEIGRLAEQTGAADCLASASRLDEFVRYASAVEPLARHDQMKLLVDGDPLTQEFSNDASELSQLAEEQQRTADKNRHWRRKLAPEETSIALGQARLLEGKFSSLFKPSWWRLRRILKSSYNFKAHSVRPTWTQVLEKLEAEHAAAAKLAARESALRERYGFDGHAAEFVQRIAALREMTLQLPPHLQAAHRVLLDAPQPQAIVQSILQAGPQLESLRVACGTVLDDYADLDFRQLRDEWSRIEAALGDLDDILMCLADLARLPAEVAVVIRRFSCDVVALEAAVGERSLQRFYRRDRQTAHFNHATRDRYAERLEQAYQRWLSGNAASVRKMVCARFLENVRVASLPASQLSAEQKEFKKLYNRGRRELEHEFGKSTRYKSIRDLVAGESGLVVKDLKPVWLMSPLSVSDTLPLETDHFDVVIFDEASQITLEEAVPSLFRAPQTIVVGDEMQLPPTDFFSAKRPDEDELALPDDGGEVVQYDLASNSFLNHAGKNLSSTMLGWHYRSRSESLISFSNWAFYQGRLLTVPEERLTLPGRPEITARAPEHAVVGAEALLERPVSFHFIEHGVYEQRRNRAEADYIAHLVRELLRRKSGMTIGVVAFSEAQQAEIEDALQRLGEQDGEFRQWLEAEFEREEDAQFVGLLVKNLENIQGDERDVVIMSVCYGHDPGGRMLMNFGPINKSGGEKRLNVAFSRAKHHMALVSSIQSHDVTNDYNDGANCLKNYLRYAAALSVGNVNVARSVLRDVAAVQPATATSVDSVADVVAEHIAAVLRERGYCVDHNVGQSHFRCDLAVRRAGEPAYRLGILLDDENHYGQTDLLEREMMRPRLLRAFGWQIACVLTKEWLADQEKTVEGLLRLLDDDHPNDQASPPIGTNDQ